MRQGAQGWCTGMTQRDGMRRKVGGGFRMGNMCTPMADSCYSLQLKKKSGGKKKMFSPLNQNKTVYLTWVLMETKGIAQR